MDDELGNQIELSNNCRRKLFEQATRSLRRSLSLLDLELVECGHGKPRSRLRRRKAWRGHYHLILVYFLLKFAALSWLQLKYDRLLRLWWALIGATSLEQCLEPSSLSNLTGEAQQLLARLALTRHQLERIGSPLTDTPGSFLYVLYFLYPIILLPVGWLALQLCELRVDWLAFLHEPLKECRRLELELEQLVWQLFHSASQHGQSAILLTQLIRQRLGHSTRLPHYGHRLHRSLTRLVRNWLALQTLVCSVIFLLMAANYLLLFLQRTLELRLAQLDCRRRHPGALLARMSHFPGHPVFANVTDQRDQRAYRAYDERQSLGQYLHLLLRVEPKYWGASPQSLLTWLEMSLSTVIIVTSFGLSFMLFIVTVVDKILWLRRINGKLERCIKLVAAGQQQQQQQQSPAELCARTYLEWALFRGQFGRLRRLASLMMSQVALVNIIHLLLVHLTRGTLGGTLFRYNLTALVFVNFFVGLNGYFGTYAYLYFLVEQTVRRINRLVAAIEAQRGSLELQFWREMWRRQVLDGRSVGKLFGLTLFTIQIVFANLIQVNVYPAAIFTYLV